MIRTRTYQIPMEEGPGTHGAGEYLLVMVEDWPDGSQTLAVKHPTPTSDGVWSRKFEPVREETSGESTDEAFARYLLTARQMQDVEDIEERRAGA